MYFYILFIGAEYYIKKSEDFVQSMVYFAKDYNLQDYLNLYIFINIFKTSHFFEFFNFKLNIWFDL